MSFSQRVKEAFPTGHFGAPCSMADILEAERELQIALPEVLKEFYLAFNGFRGGGYSEFYFRLSTTILALRALTHSSASQGSCGRAVSSIKS